MPNRRILWWYAVRNAIPPQLTQLAIALGGVVSGSILVEIIFAYPGLGYLLYMSIVNSDYTVIQGITLMLAVSVGLAVLIIDLIYPRLDPRVNLRLRAFWVIQLNIRSAACSCAIVDRPFALSEAKGSMTPVRLQTAAAIYPITTHMTTAYFPTSAPKLSARTTWRAGCSVFSFFKHNWLFTLGFSLLLGLYLFGAIGSFFVDPDRADMGANPLNQSPACGPTPLGTEGFGRDVFTLMVLGIPTPLRSASWLAAWAF